MSQRIEQNTEQTHGSDHPGERLANSNVNVDRAAGTAAAPLRSSNISGDKLASEHGVKVAGPSIGGTAAPYDSTKIDAAKDHLVESMGGLDLNKNETPVHDTTAAGEKPHDQEQGHSITDTVVSGAVAVAAGAVAAGSAALTTALNWISPNKDEEHAKDHHDGVTNDSEQFPSMVVVDAHAATSAPADSVPSKQALQQKEQQDRLDHENHPVGHDNKAPSPKPTKDHHVSKAPVLGATSLASSAPPPAAVLGASSATSAAPPVKDDKASSAPKASLKDKISSIPAALHHDHGPSVTRPEHKEHDHDQRQHLHGPSVTRPEHKEHQHGPSVTRPEHKEHQHGPSVTQPEHKGHAHDQLHHQHGPSVTRPEHKDHQHGPSVTHPEHKENQDEHEHVGFKEKISKIFHRHKGEETEEKKHQHQHPHVESTAATTDPVPGYNKHPHASAANTSVIGARAGKEAGKSDLRGAPGGHQAEAPVRTEEVMWTAQTTDPIPGYGDKNKSSTASDAATMDTAATRYTSLGKNDTTNTHTNPLPISERARAPLVGTTPAAAIGGPAANPLPGKVTDFTGHGTGGGVDRTAVDPTRVQANERQGRHL